MIETDHQWELLLVCFICFILFQSILEYSLYILIVSSVSVTEKKTCPKKNLHGFCAVSMEEMSKMWNANDRRMDDGRTDEGQQAIA